MISSRTPLTVLGIVRTLSAGKNKQGVEFRVLRKVNLELDSTKEDDNKSAD
jgi:hypothetical protein